MTDTDLIDERPNRRVRSYVVRAGRMTEGQERNYRELWPQYGLELSDGRLDYAQCFGREAPVVLEIGFGMGDSLIEMARHMPEKNFIGIEVHPPGVGRLLGRIEEEKLTNIRVFCDDAIEVLSRCIPDASLDTLQLFFPDPWPKKRHHKRRIVQTEFAQSLREKLKLGGQFHMATDWEPYAEHMMEVMSAAEGYENAAGAGVYAPQPEWRPVTKFQKRGENLGHGVWDLIFTRTA
jgi:tRNA (guanine-N7-)-methyltransferase